MTAWPKRPVHWVEGDTAFVSCVFTWQLQAAYSLCSGYRQQGYRVRVGGPAVVLSGAFLGEVATLGGEVPALVHHNPEATFTTRGCVRRCQFCAVHRIEPEYRELPDAEWEPKPIVCDNNILAASQKHFDRVIDRLKGIKGVDFNQGLDARLLTDHHVSRLTELDLAIVRFAWDHTRDESAIMGAIGRVLAAGVPKRRVRVYVLIGFDDTPEDALYRLESVRARGIWPNPMRYQPLETTRKNSYVGPAWTDRELSRMMRYYSRLRWLEHIPFAAYAR